MYRKVVKTGHILELYEIQYRPFRSKGGRKPRGDTEETEQSNYQETQIRRRNDIKRLAIANFDEHSKFITLTYSDNITDIKQSNYEFKKFVERLKYKYGKFKYLAVIEFQKRGAIHYHMISDLPYIDNNELREIWGNGFVKINDISKVDNVGAYLIKYMSKDNNDKRLMGEKAYLCSRGLKRPEIISDSQVRGWHNKAVDKVLLEIENKKPVYTGEYETDYLGKINYKEYNLKRKN